MGLWTRLRATACVSLLVLLFAAATASAGPLKPNQIGGLDCNGFSPIQKTVLPPIACTDPHGFTSVSNSNTWGGRFYDNGHYIGHDEPNIAFFSNHSGSGDNVTWTETLPTDPTAAPTVASPGSDVTHYVELSVTPWFALNLCDPSSYPQSPCAPNSDANAPDPCTISANPCPNGYEGGGSAFLEVQFYPPGEGPFVENISCDNSHWCASLHINEAICTYLFANCNPNCLETTNFAFIQKDGIPTGPASPQQLDNASATPNGETLLMNSGDTVRVHIFDAPVPAPGSGHALEVVVDDLTTGQTGFMQASAANGYARTSIVDCTGTPFNFEPEYSSSRPQNISPWGAIAANTSSSVEIGHFTPCTSVSGFAGDGAGGAGDPVFSNCTGPYETDGDSGINSALGFPEDLPCYTKGDTHGTLMSDPNVVAGCESLIAGDLDFDGASYWPDWPTGTTPTRFPGSFTVSPPTSNASTYSKYEFQTDTALSESTCSFTSGAGCTVPPAGPGNFYPFWSIARVHGNCAIEFGNVTTGSGVDDFGGDAEYGSVQSAKLGYPEFIGKPIANNCST